MNESTLAEVKLSLLGHSDFFARARHNLFVRRHALILHASGAGLAFMPIVDVTFGYVISQVIVACFRVCTRVFLSFYDAASIVPL